MEETLEKAIKNQEDNKESVIISHRKSPLNNVGISPSVTCEKPSIFITRIGSHHPSCFGTCHVYFPVYGEQLSMSRHSHYF